MVDLSSEKSKLSIKYCCKYVSPHYNLYFSKNSLGSKDIKEIAKNQELCYDKITKTLNIFPKFKIQYLLADNPEDLGVIYGDNEPCNGFTKLPNMVFAVYNDKIKCIGMHEDAHIISYSIKRPKIAFLREGLAMYFDETWQGISNNECCKKLAKQNELKNIYEMLNNDKFFSFPDFITYPLAGSFTSFLIDKLSLKVYLQTIYYNDNAIVALKKIFKDKDMQNEFLNWLNEN